MNSFAADALCYAQFSNYDYRGTAQRLRQAYPQARTVLEVGAGTGLLTRELQQEGFEVTAIEPCPAMRRHLHRCDVFPGPVQAFRARGRRFDVGVACNDVLNYVPFSDIENVVAKLRGCCDALELEVWDPHAGVRPLQIRRRGGTFRIRLAFENGGVVCVWFLYVGLCCPRISYHRLYLHDPGRLWCAVGRPSCCTAGTRA